MSGFDAAKLAPLPAGLLFAAALQQWASAYASPPALAVYAVAIWLAVLLKAKGLVLAAVLVAVVVGAQAAGFDTKVAPIREAAELVPTDGVDLSGLTEAVSR